MKREILCLPCAERVSRTITGCKVSDFDGRIVDPYPGEHSKFLKGVLHCHCYCDNCSDPLYPGNEAIALSIWADNRGIPYYPWEQEYLERIERRF